MSRYAKTAVCAAAVIAALLTTILNSKTGIDYCKSIVRSGNKVFILDEKDIYSSVIKLDSNGEPAGKINFLTADLFAASIKSFHTMFADEEGELYLCCKVYKNKKDCSEEIYNCDFKLGTLKKVWSSDNAAGYTFSEGGVPCISEGIIYVAMDNSDSGNTDILAFSDNGYEVAVKDVVSRSSEVERIVLTPYGAAAMTMRNGIFLDGKRIYPPAGNTRDCIVNGLGYENNLLNFIDINTREIIHYDLVSEELFSESCEGVETDHMQGITVYSDGGICASYEDGESLRGACFTKSAHRIYSVIKGRFSAVMFIKLLIAEAAVLTVAAVIYRLFFVRRIRRTAFSKDGKYVAVVSEITAVSVAASFCAAAVFGAIIFGTINKIDEYWRNSDNINSSQYLSGYALLNVRPLTGDGIPQLDPDSYARLDGIITDYRESLDSSSECSFNIMIISGGSIYCIYTNEFYGAAPAEYAISHNALDMISDSMNGFSSVSFEDRRTIGRLRYTVFPFIGYDSDEAFCPVAICAVTDEYRGRLSAMMAVYPTAAITAGIAVVLLTAANIVLRSNLLKLGKLEKAFAAYRKSGDPAGFNIGGSDEIARTGQALALMAEGIRVCTRDINEGNRRYRSLIPTGILKLMGRGEISGVSIGEYRTEQALIIRFLPDAGADMRSALKGAAEFSERNGGYVLNFSRDKIDICFTEESKYVGIMKELPTVDCPAKILVSMGEVQAGSAGDSSNAWLVAVSKEFATFEKMGVSCLGSITADIKCAELIRTGFQNDGEVSDIEVME